MDVASAREDADHRPVAVPERDPGADLEARELARGLPAHDDLADAALEGPALHDPELLADGEGRGLDAPEGHVVRIALPAARQVDHHHQLRRRERPPGGIPGDPGQRAQKDGRVPGHAARELRVRPGPEQDHPVRTPGAGERVAEALRHRENGHEDGYNARDPDHDHQRGAEPLGQGPKIEERDPGDLLEGAHRRPSQRCPARASTIRRRCARSAGGRPIASPSASTISAPMSHVSAVT